MGEISTIGLDLAKTVFQAHGADASGGAAAAQRARQGGNGIVDQHRILKRAGFGQKLGGGAGCHLDRGVTHFTRGGLGRLLSSVL